VLILAWDEKTNCTRRVDVCQISIHYNIYTRSWTEHPITIAIYTSSSSCLIIFNNFHASWYLSVCLFFIARQSPKVEARTSRWRWSNRKRVRYNSINTKHEIKQTVGSPPPVSPIFSFLVYRSKRYPPPLARPHSYISQHSI